jgi:iron complex transport system ATP-binding protein
MKNPILVFDSLSFHYPSNQRQVLTGLNLTLSPGRTTAILGPNGSGKTTLLHLALGWLKPDGGQILLNGRPLESFSRQELGRQIGLVSQSEHIAFEYSVLEYVLLGRAPYLRSLEMPGAADCRRALWALDRVGLVERADHSILKLSGGERQLVLLARALAQEPRLILMDEPTAHLDLANKKRLLEIIRVLTQEGITVILTTHEPDFAAVAAVDLVLIREGCVQEAGPLEQIFTSEKISLLYDAPVNVVDIDGQKLVAWSRLS